MADVNVEALLDSTARACARGHKQLSFVNELLGWRDVKIYVHKTPTASGYIDMVYYGETLLAGSSWVNLRRRLVGAGFVVVRDKEWRSVRLTHPALGVK